MEFRPAVPEDAAALTDLERDANLVALAHVFGDTPYPWEEVYVCWDAVVLRHLAVRPERWGDGLARRAIERAADAHRLWCLVENRRARGLYEHLGWQPTGLEREAEWPPYPREMEYAR